MSARRRTALMVSIAMLGSVVGVVGVAQAVHYERNRSYGDRAPVCRVTTDRPVVALSFDDAPDPVYTPAVLSLLQRYGDTATFFLVGERAKQYPDLVRQDLDAGMETGNHTWSHPHLPALTAGEADSQVSRTQTLLARDAGTTHLFRAPYGTITPGELAVVERAGLRPVHWSLPLDHYVGGLGLAPAEAVAAIVQDIRPGDIILAHDAHLLPQDGGGGRGPAMAALRLLLPALRQHGFEVTTVGDLLGRGVAVAAAPRPWFWETGFTCPAS